MISLNGATLSTPFNSIIANIFYKAGFVESWDNYTFNSLQVTFYKTQQKSTKEKMDIGKCFK